MPNQRVERIVPPLTDVVRLLHACEGSSVQVPHTGTRVSRYAIACGKSSSGRNAKASSMPQNGVHPHAHYTGTLTQDLEPKPTHSDTR